MIWEDHYSVLVAVHVSRLFYESTRAYSKFIAAILILVSRASIRITCSSDLGLWFPSDFEHDLSILYAIYIIIAVTEEEGNFRMLIYCLVIETLNCMCCTFTM